MMIMIQKTQTLLLAATTLALTVSSRAQTPGAVYSLSSSLSGQDFLDAFQWQAIPDPTHGNVNYVTEQTAAQQGLYQINGGSLILRADDTTVLQNGGPGRNSFRLMSYDQYTSHVAMQVSFDIAHMPEGCGTWPAVFGGNWPNQGEIDIVEGVNNQPPNLSTLHTGPGCTMPPGRLMTGQDMGDDCDVNDTNNQSCGVRLADPNSFGPSFNQVGGGWYAMERSSTYIAIWFWERGDATVPQQVSSPGGTVDTSTWGEPAAYFPNTDCDFSTVLGAHNIIINLAFCGDWAGNNYATSGCPSDCVDYVNQNPSAFTNAYFDFNALNIFE